MPAEFACCVCGGSTTRAAAKIIVLTVDEKVAVRKLGQEPQDEYVYCRPCMNALNDRERGARLLKGVFQIKLQSSGVPNAERQAQRFYDFLVKRAAPKPR